MKHLCENCLFCNRVVKDNGYKTYCCWRPNKLMDSTAEIILGRVKQCKHHEKKYLTLDEGFDKLLKSMNDTLEFMRKDREKGND